jgi:hypothetical protein
MVLRTSISSKDSLLRQIKPKVALTAMLCRHDHIRLGKSAIKEGKAMKKATRDRGQKKMMSVHPAAHD